jgi:hypothetical protein
MSGKWFSNRGQIVQILIAFFALVVGLLVAFPQLPVQQGFQGFISTWPIIIFPLVALLLMWLNNNRMHKTIEALIPKPLPGPPPGPLPVTDTEPATLRSFTADPFLKPAAVGQDGWRITDIYVLNVRIKVGSYWDEPSPRNKMRISAVAIREEPGRRAAELSVRTGGSLVYGGKQSDQVSTNRYTVTISGSGFDAEERSIYQFSFDDEHIHLFVIRVDGLDTALQEVALQVAKLRVLRFV